MAAHRAGLGRPRGRADPPARCRRTLAGLTDGADHATPWFRDSWTFNGIIAGLADYRPPPAAYLAALEPVEAVQHWFYHGTRPELTEADEVAEGGVELYHATPTFLLSAGGSFLNSGYGSDELTGYHQVAIAQSATLIPRRADPLFGGLVRFDPFPGDHDADGDEQLPRDAVTNGVHEGFACGANMAVPQAWVDRAGGWDGPWLVVDLDNQNAAPADRLGFHLAVYRTALTSNDSDRLKVNYNSVCETFGWLYAMDATALPFADFAQRIRERNTFPAQLEWDAKYTFVTPEDTPRRFAFWNRPGQFKRTPRIYAVDDVPLILSCGRTAADQGQSVLDVANELDYLGTAVLSPFSVELAADAEQAAVDVLRAHPPTDS